MKSLNQVRYLGGIISTYFVRSSVIYIFSTTIIYWGAILLFVSSILLSTAFFSLPKSYIPQKQEI